MLQELAQTAVSTIKGKMLTVLLADGAAAASEAAGVGAGPFQVLGAALPVGLP